MVHNGRIIWNGPKDKMEDTGNPVLDQFVHGHPEGPMTPSSDNG